MASYEETVNALGPVAFWRLNELIGSVMSDSSGNGLDGTLYSGCTFGLPSPIETDPASFAIGGAVGERAAPVGSQLDIRNNITTGGWVLRRDGYNANTATLLSRDSHWSLLGAAKRINSGETLVKDTWHFLVGVRNGAVMRLYHNAVLVAERTDLLVSDEYPRQILGLNDGHPEYSIGTGLGSTTKWIVGLDASVFFGDVDEPFIFDYPLNEAQITEIYEAALNSLLLTGYSNVIPTAILYSDIEPDPISFPSLRHNWNDPLIERISFATGISTATKGYESANAQRIKPRREIEISQVLRDDTERRQLRAKLNAHQNHKWFIPILEDRERLTTPISSGINVIATDTVYKDYEVGGYVELRQLNNAGQVTANEQLLITGLTNTQITTATQTVNSYTSPEVMPSRRAILDASVSPRGHTDSVEEMTILARLIAEDEKTVPHRIIEWTPTLSYKSHEVFDPATWQSSDWTEPRDYSVDRARQDVDFESGVFVTESDTNAASESFTYRMLLEGKDKHAALLGWFYARAGSLNYLWVPTMQKDFTAISVAGSDLTVEGHNYFEDFAGSEFRRDLAFIYNNNAMALRRISGVSLSGANEVLTLVGGAPTLTNLRSVSYLLFCRMDGDTLEIARITDTKARFAWRFREMLASPA